MQIKNVSAISHHTCRRVIDHREAVRAGRLLLELCSGPPGPHEIQHDQRRQVQQRVSVLWRGAAATFCRASFLRVGILADRRRFLPGHAPSCDGSLLGDFQGAERNWQKRRQGPEGEEGESRNTEVLLCCLFRCCHQMQGVRGSRELLSAMHTMLGVVRCIIAFLPTSLPWMQRLLAATDHELHDMSESLLVSFPTMPGVPREHPWLPGDRESSEACCARAEARYAGLASSVH